MATRCFVYAAAFVLLRCVLLPELLDAQDKSARAKKPATAQPKKLPESNREFKLLQLPDEVRQAFEQAYPTDEFIRATSVQRSGEMFYKISARNATKQRELLFAADGKLVELVEIISPVELPEAIKEAVRSEHADAAIVSTKKIVSAAPTLYEVTTKQGEEQAVTVYDTKGNVVRKVDVLPSAVQKAFSAAYPNAEILAFRRYENDGIAYWVIESKEGNTFRETIYAEGGELIRLTESLSPLELPEAIKETLADSFAGAAITSVQRRVNITYHIGVNDSTGNSTLALDATGRLINLHSESEPDESVTLLAQNASADKAGEQVAAKDREISLLKPQPVKATLPVLKLDSLAVLKPLPAVEVPDERKPEKRIIVIRRYYAPSLIWIPPVVRIWRPSWWW